MKLRMTRSTGNVFRDLGFSIEEAEHLRVRADLMAAAQQAIAKRMFPQGKAAKLLGVNRTTLYSRMNHTDGKER